MAWRNYRGVDICNDRRIPYPTVGNNIEMTLNNCGNFFDEMGFSIDLTNQIEDIRIYNESGLGLRISIHMYQWDISTRPSFRIYTSTPWSFMKFKNKAGTYTNLPLTQNGSTYEYIYTAQYTDEYYNLSVHEIGLVLNNCNCYQWNGVSYLTNSIDFMSSEQDTSKGIYQDGDQRAYSYYKNESKDLNAKGIPVLDDYDNTEGYLYNSKGCGTFGFINNLEYLGTYQEQETFSTFVNNKFRVYDGLDYYEKEGPFLFIEMNNYWNVTASSQDISWNIINEHIVPTMQTGLYIYQPNTNLSYFYGSTPSTAKAINNQPIFNNILSFATETVTYTFNYQSTDMTNTIKILLPYVKNVSMWEHAIHLRDKLNVYSLGSETFWPAGYSVDNTTGEIEYDTNPTITLNTGVNTTNPTYRTTGGITNELFADWKTNTSKKSAYTFTNVRYTLALHINGVSHNDKYWPLNRDYMTAGSLTYPCIGYEEDKTSPNIEYSTDKLYGGVRNYIIYPSSGQEWTLEAHTKVLVSNESNYTTIYNWYCKSIKPTGLYKNRPGYAINRYAFYKDTTTNHKRYFVLKINSIKNT